MKITALRTSAAGVWLLRRAVLFTQVQSRFLCFPGCCPGLVSIGADRAKLFVFQVLRVKVKDEGKVKMVSMSSVLSLIEMLQYPGGGNYSPVLKCGNFSQR